VFSGLLSLELGLTREKILGMENRQQSSQVSGMANTWEFPMDSTFCGKNE
jgi:hypothetical protein